MLTCLSYTSVCDNLKKNWAPLIHNMSWTQRWSLCLYKQGRFWVTGRLFLMPTYMRQFLCCVSCTLFIDPWHAEHFSRHQCVVRLMSVNRGSSVDTGAQLTVGRFFFPSLLSIGHPGVKRPGREADHSPLFNAQVRNVWSYTTIPLHAQGQLCRYLDHFVCSLLQQLVILLLPRFGFNSHF